MKLGSKCLDNPRNVLAMARSGDTFAKVTTGNRTTFESTMKASKASSGTAMIDRTRRPANSAPRYEKGATLLALALRLQGSHSGLTIDEMSEFLREREHPHGRRTVERMRDALERLCPDFLCINPDERPLRYRIDTGPSALSALSHIEAADLVALKTAAKLLIRENLTDQAATVERIFLALQAQLPATRKRRIEPDLELLLQSEGIALRPGPRVVISTERMRTLRDAILRHHRLRIKYKARGTKLQSRHIVEPYAIVYGQRPYLLARSVGLKHMSYWSLTNICELEPLAQPFRRRKFSLERYLERSFGVFQEKPSKVTWIFDTEVAEEADQYAFHPTQRKRWLKDHRLEVRFTAGGRQEMDWYLATWGGHITADYRR